MREREKESLLLLNENEFDFSYKKICVRSTSQVQSKL